MAAQRAWQRLCAIVAGERAGIARRSRWVRLVAGLLATALGLMVMLNVALNLGGSRPFLARLISESPRTFNIDYRRAWSFWPTVVELRRVELHGSDSNVQWQIEIEEARVSIDLVALFKHEFHATHVRALGIGFRLRRLLDAGAATGDRIAPLPTIGGFNAPPLREAHPNADESPHEPRGLWSVRIENVDGRVRQIWIDEFHFEGDVRVAGAFFLRPGLRLWVGPAHAAILSGGVVVGGRELLGHMLGSANCEIPSFDLRTSNGIEVFRFISGNVRLDASIPNVRALDYYARIRGSPIRFAGGAGLFHVDGVLHSGVVHSLNFSSSTTDVSVVDGAWLALGNVLLSAKAGAEGPSAWSGRFAPVELRWEKTKGAVVQARELQIDTSISEINLSKPAPALQIHANLASASIPSLRIVNEFISRSSQLHVDGGKASVSGHLDADTGTNSANGSVALDADGLTAHVGDLHVAGRLDANAHFTKLLFDNGDLDLFKVVIDVRDVTLRDPHAVLADWWSSVEIRASRIRPAHRIPLDLSWTAKLASAAPVLAFSKHSPALPGWIVRFLAGGEVKASGRLQAGKGFMELSSLRATTGLLNVDGDFRVRGAATAGVFRVSAGPLSVGIELANDETKLIFAGTPIEPALK